MHSYWYLIIFQEILVSSIGDEEHSSLMEMLLHSAKKGYYMNQTIFQVLMVQENYLGTMVMKLLSEFCDTQSPLSIATYFTTLIYLAQRSGANACRTLKKIQGMFAIHTISKILDISNFFFYRFKVINESLRITS